MSNSEVYKDMPDYEGLYMISNYGNVKSLPKGDGNGGRERLLKTDIHGNSVKYLRVTLSKEGKTKRISIHRTVAKVFIENPENKPCVNHIDNNGMNNNLSNLEWCTHKENMSHSFNQGRLDCGIISGSRQATKNRKAKAEAKGRKLIGDRFIKVITKNSSNYILFTCLCGEELCRNIGSIVIDRGGVCRPCNIKLNNN